MASIVAFPCLLSSSCRTNAAPSHSSFSSSSLSFFCFQRRTNASFTSNHWQYFTKHSHQNLRRIRAVAEETIAPEEAPVATTDQTVSVPVSPSDVLTMFFQAEGTMSEAAIPKVTKALEEVEDVSDLKVQIIEGVASVELTKQTTVQATGVASNLVEVIQGSGFKLQTLNLSFEDEEDTAG